MIELIEMSDQRTEDARNHAASPTDVFKLLPLAKPAHAATPSHAVYHPSSAKQPAESNPHE
jgi:hypothetical protein